MFRYIIGNQTNKFNEANLAQKRAHNVLRKVFPFDDHTSKTHGVFEKKLCLKIESTIHVISSTHC